MIDGSFQKEIGMEWERKKESERWNELFLSLLSAWEHSCAAMMSWELAPGRQGCLCCSERRGRTLSPHEKTEPYITSIQHTNMCVGKEAQTLTQSVCVRFCVITLEEFFKFCGAFLLCFRLLSWLFDALNIWHWFLLNMAVWHSLSKKHNLKYRSRQLIVNSCIKQCYML